MRKNFKTKSLITTLLITLISLNIGMSVDWSDDQYLYVQEGQVLTGQALRDSVDLRISLILKIIAFAVLIISLCVVLLTKDKEKRKKRKKVSIVTTIGAFFISIIYDFISWWLRIQNQQTVYGVAPIEIKKVSTFPEDAISLPEPKTSVINVIVNLAQRIVPAIAFIIGIVSFIRILMTKDKELKKKRIRNTLIVVSTLVLLLIAVFVVPTRLLTK